MTECAMIAKTGDPTLFGCKRVRRLYATSGALSLAATTIFSAVSGVSSVYPAPSRRRRRTAMAATPATAATPTAIVAYPAALTVLDEATGRERERDVTGREWKGGGGSFPSLA